MINYFSLPSFINVLISLLNSITKSFESSKLNDDYLKSTTVLPSSKIIEILYENILENIQMMNVALFDTLQYYYFV